MPVNMGMMEDMDGSILFGGSMKGGRRKGECGCSMARECNCRSGY
jgi:hypothetical protein